jgi:hypothetical protein
VAPALLQLLLQGVWQRPLMHCWPPVQQSVPHSMPVPGQRYTQAPFEQLPTCSPRLPHWLRDICTHWLAGHWIMPKVQSLLVPHERTTQSTSHLPLRQLLPLGHMSLLQHWVQQARHWLLPQSRVPLGHSPAAQTPLPVQAPGLSPTLGQALLPVHSPVALQVWGTWPLHCLLPGMQAPPQAPLLQTKLHAVPGTQAPFSSQVSGTSMFAPPQRFAPGLHSPVH